MSLAAQSGGDEVKAFECRFSDGTLPCKPNLSQMTDEQLGEYSGLLARYFTLLHLPKGRVLGFEAMNGALLDGGFSEQAERFKQQVTAAFGKANAEHPDTFLRPLPGVTAKP